MNFVYFDVLEWREEERRVSRENRKQHAEDVTEEDFANAKPYKEGNFSIPPFVSLDFISFYFIFRFFSVMFLSTWYPVQIRNV